jgi:hypothetical protein
MGRTVPSFRIVLVEEKAKWKPFRYALDKKEKKDFDDMWDIPRLYVSACSTSVQLVPLHPIIISILFHHYKELKECSEAVKQIEEAAVVRNKHERIRRLAEKEEGEEQLMAAATTAITKISGRQLKLIDDDYNVPIE